MEYEIYRLIWWVILGILLIGYAIMDGFDLGVATLLPFTARTDIERRMVINSVGPFWEGNQVWLIAAGGAIFAAWPYIYAVSFSGFYLAMFLILLALILRPVAFKYRSKEKSKQWRSTWDWIHFLTGVLPSLLAGVAVGNAMVGVPFYFDTDLAVNYTGSFLDLLNPFSILIGLVSLSMLIRHGALYTAMKVDEPVATRALKIAKVASWIMILLVIISGIWSYYLKSYVITSEISLSGPSNPLNKTVSVISGAWFNTFLKHKWMFIAPFMSVVFSILSVVIANKSAYKKAFVLSSLSVFGTVSTAGLAMFPFLLPSSSFPNQSLTIWDSSSSLLTLKVMLVVTVVMLPIILSYTAWVYYMLRGKITAAIFGSENKDVY